MGKLTGLPELLCPPCSADVNRDQPEGEAGRMYRCPRCRVDWTPTLLCDDMNIIEEKVLTDYHRAVTTKAPQGDLTRILLALAGCELVLAHTDLNASEAHTESARVLLEVAKAAIEGIEHTGPLDPDYRTDPIARALRAVAFAYATADHVDQTSRGSVGQALDDLATVLPTEILLPLMKAHGHEYHARTPGSTP